MLLLRTLKGQSINIGKDKILTLLRINRHDWSVDLSLNTGEGESVSFSLSSGISIQLLPLVTLTLTRILVDSEEQAVLGFKAPKDIKIRGEWARAKRNYGHPTFNPITLRNMRLEEIISYAEMKASSSLEKELLTRLMKLNKILEEEA